MRPIDADALKSKINTMYKTAEELKDTELKKFLAVAAGLVDREPIIDVRVINAKYSTLPFEQRKAVDSLIDCLCGENLKREERARREEDEAGRQD